MKKIIIAIDGPAGSGKTTTAKQTAKRLSYIYIDTGAMYRAVTYAWLGSGLPMDEKAVASLMSRINLEIVHTDAGQKTLLNGKDISEEIRLPEVTASVSEISAFGCVRDKLVEQQRNIGKSGGVVCEGRDIGTVVFPNAELKIYLVASIESRAQRRTLELSQKGLDFSVDEIKKQIAARDKFDSSRTHSPLRKAKDAVEIDTSGLSIEQQTEKVVELARSII